MNNVKSKDLKISDLYLNGVWTWSTDLMLSEDSLVPVELTHDALACVDTLLIHAKFLTASGNSHEGLVIYDPDSDEVYALELFLGDSKVVLNRYVKDFSELSLKNYEKITGASSDGVLPIRYEVVVNELSILPGEFALKE